MGLVYCKFIYLKYLYSMILRIYRYCQNKMYRIDLYIIYRFEKIKKIKLYQIYYFIYL